MGKINNALFNELLASWSMTHPYTKEQIRYDQAKKFFEKHTLIQVNTKIQEQRDIYKQLKIFFTNAEADVPEIQQNKKHADDHDMSIVLEESEIEDEVTASPGIKRRGCKQDLHRTLIARAEITRFNLANVRKDGVRGLTTEEKLDEETALAILERSVKEIKRLQKKSEQSKRSRLKAEAAKAKRMSPRSLPGIQLSSTKAGTPGASQPSSSSQASSYAVISEAQIVEYVNKSSGIRFGSSNTDQDVATSTAEHEKLTFYKEEIADENVTYSLELPFGSSQAHLDLGNTGAEQGDEVSDEEELARVTDYLELQFGPSEDLSLPAAQQPNQVSDEEMINKYVTDCVELPPGSSETDLDLATSAAGEIHEVDIIGFVEFIDLSE